MGGGGVTNKIIHSEHVFPFLKKCVDLLQILCSVH